MQQTTDLIKVDDFKAIIEAAPSALEGNKIMLDRAKQQGEPLKARIEDGTMDDDLDLQINDHLVKLKKAKELANNRRNPLTKLFDDVRKVFTGIEKELDAEIETFQRARDRYAAEKIAQEKERQRKAAIELEKQKERVNVKAKLEAELQQAFLSDIEKEKKKHLDNFSKITLANFEKAEAHFRGQLGLASYSEEMFKGFMSFTGSPVLTADEVNQIRAEVMNGKYEPFKKQYESTINETIQLLVDRLAGKKKELEEIRAKEEEAARLAAAAKSEAERKKAEEARLAAERQKAEAEARAKAEEEARAKAEAEARAKAEAEAAAKKEVAMAETLFTHEATNAILATETPKGREGYEITVNAPPGIMLVISQWWQHEGRNLTVEQLKKKKVDSMITFCEKHAHRTGEKIESPLITYTETFTTRVTK